MNDKPFRPPPGARISRPEPSAEETSPPAPVILIAGCDSGLRDRLCDWVREEFPQCRVMVANDVAEVRHDAVQGQPVLALVNVDAPGLHGFEMLRLIRTLAPHTAPVALSTYHSDTHREYAIGAGAVTCVSPQVINGDLRHLIVALLQSAARRGAP